MLSIMPEHQIEIQTTINGITFDERSRYVSDIINRTIRKREGNNRDNIQQAMIAGRFLTAIRPEIPVRDWTQWLIQNTEYKHRDAANKDMNLWKTWSPRLEHLIQLGIIRDVENPEYEFVSTFTEEDIAINAGSISLTAMHVLQHNGVPDEAIDTTLALLERGQAITVRETRNIINSTKVAQSFENPSHQSIAMELIHDGVTNPEILSAIPQLAQHEELITEIRESGHLFVPGVNKSVPVSNLGVTDIELALGNAQYWVEGAVRNGSTAKTETHEKGGRIKFINKTKGNKQEILEQLSKIISEYAPDVVFHVNVSAELD